MGITIHFKGKLDDQLLIYSLMDELIDISESMQWKYQTLDEDWNTPATARISSQENVIRISGNLALKGIQINLHPDCEPLSLYFDKDGNLSTPASVLLLNKTGMIADEISSSVKTQFAPPGIHISIIKLLKYLKKRYINNLQVIDEGTYWDTEDEEILLSKINFTNGKLNMVGEIISSVDQNDLQNCFPEKLADILESKLKKYLGK